MSKHFGSEIIETGPGSAIVTERKAATALLVGTAPIGDVHDTPAKRANYINKVITITKKEGIAKAFGGHKAGFTIPAALEDMFAQAGPKGIGEIDVVNVYNPDTHTAANPVKNTDIVGEFSASGQPSGLQHAYASYQRAGRFSKILLTPGFTGMTGVRAALQAISARTRARALIDAPAGSTLAQVLQARGTGGAFDFQFSDRHLVAMWPHLMMMDTATGTRRTSPYSGAFAGRWLSTIMEKGYHHSPSNHPLILEDTEVPVTYIPGDGSCDVQQLRAAGIVTTEERYGKGPHTSGNRSSAYPTTCASRPSATATPTS